MCSTKKTTTNDINEINAAIQIPTGQSALPRTFSTDKCRAVVNVHEVHQRRQYEPSTKQTNVMMDARQWQASRQALR